MQLVRKTTREALGASRYRCRFGSASEGGYFCKIIGVQARGGNAYE